MRKLLILVLLVSILMGMIQPATALLDNNKLNINVNINNAITVQNQIAIPISIGNTAFGGDAGNQDIAQQAIATVNQRIKSEAEDFTIDD